MQDRFLQSGKIILFPAPGNLSTVEYWHVQSYVADSYNIVTVSVVVTACTVGAVITVPMDLVRRSRRSSHVHVGSG